MQLKTACVQVCMHVCVHIDLDMISHGHTRMYTVAGAVCGDGTRDTDEACDDGNYLSGDGCSEMCTIEPGYICVSTGYRWSQCMLMCGDGTKDAGEACDDGNDVNGDGCSETCTIEQGFTCSLEPTGNSKCTTFCGDGFKTGFEACDDGNDVSGEGCSEDCTVESGYSCVDNGQGQSVCSLGVVCGDGTKDASEPCDDGNTGNGDGCSDTCTVESGYECVDNAQKQSICNLASGGGKGGKTRGTGGGNSRTRAPGRNANLEVTVREPHSAIRSTSTLPAPESADGYSRSLCGHSLSESPPNSNTAAYGPCIATLYHHLELSGSSSSGDPAFAGMDMTMVALKKDLYGQVLCGK